MSEVLPAKRQAAVERLRRRVDLYAKDHQGRYLHYERVGSSVCEQQMQESFALKQKYLDPKAKKTSKSKNTAAAAAAAAAAATAAAAAAAAAAPGGGAGGAERKPAVDIHAGNTQSVSSFSFVCLFVCYCFGPIHSAPNFEFHFHFEFVRFD